MRRSIPLAFAVSATLLGTTHCGGVVAPGGGHEDGGSPVPPGPSPNPGGPMPPTPTPTPTCDSLSIANDPWVSVNTVATSAPAAEGGAIVQGLYALTAMTVYTGPNGPSGGNGGVTQRATLSVTTNAMVATVEDSSTNTTKTSAISYSTSGSSLTYSEICPGTDANTIQFSATPQTLVIFVGTGGGAGAAETFTLQ